jgi:outer membrane protein TolC
VISLATFVLPTTARSEQTTTEVEDVDPESEGALDLDELVRRAVQFNLLIRAEGTRVREAEALYQRAAAMAYPAISFNALIGGPTSEARTTVVNDLSTVTPESLEADFDFGELGVTFRIGAQIVQPLYTFGKISTAKESAAHGVRAAKHNVNITLGEVLLNVHRAYWTHMMTISFAEGLEDGYRILESVIMKIETLIEEDSAQVTENDRLRLLHALATIRVRLTDARVGQSLSLQALKLLIGKEQSDALSVAAKEIEDVPEGVPSLNEQMALARVQRPEVQALSAVTQALDGVAELRIRQLFPDVYLGGVIDMAITSNATNQTNPFIYDRFNYFDLGIGIGVRAELDVFQKLAHADMAEAEARTAMARLDAVRQLVELDVQKAHQELSGSYTRLRDLEKAMTAGRGWLTSSVLAYDIGTGNARELVDSFIARATSEAEYFKTCFDIHVGSADLARAVGEMQQRYGVTVRTE